MGKIASVAFLLAISWGSHCLAADYALVVGGKSDGTEADHQEWVRSTATVTLGLKARGYEVTTLYGTGAAREVTGTDGDLQTKDSDADKYATDLAFLKRYGLPAQAASDTAIEGYFKALLAKVKPGDKIEIHINAHGLEGCVTPPCTARILIYDKNGAPIAFEAEALLGYLKQLEAAGALPTLDLNSCFSGRLGPLFAQLKATCVYYASSADGPGYGCAEGDDDKDLSFTSTGEMIALRYYAPIADTLAKDPYFRDNKCFARVKKYYDSHRSQIDLTTIESTYWSARQFDFTLAEPSLSSWLEQSYFNRDHYNHAFDEFNAAVCVRTVNESLDELSKDLAPSASALVFPLRQLFVSSIERYNKSLLVQAALKKKWDVSQSDAELRKIKLAQDKTVALAAEVVRAERKMVQQIHASALGAKDGGGACRRAL